MNATMTLAVDNSPAIDARATFDRTVADLGSLSGQGKDALPMLLSAITQFDGPVFRAFEGHAFGADGADPADFPIPVPGRCRDAGKRTGSRLGRRCQPDCRWCSDQLSARR